MEHYINDFSLSKTPLRLTLIVHINLLLFHLFLCIGEWYLIEWSNDHFSQRIIWVVCNPGLLHIKLMCSVLSRFSCVPLGNPTNGSPPGSSVHGIVKARILEWVAMPSSRGTSRPRDQMSPALRIAIREVQNKATMNIQKKKSSSRLTWERICLQCGRPGFNPELGRSPIEGNSNPLHMLA